MNLCKCISEINYDCNFYPMLSKLLRTSIISSTLAFLTLSVISSKSLAGSYRTIIITNDNSLPISFIRVRPLNTKTKWHHLIPITNNFFEEGQTKTFKVSTDQCKYTLVAEYINSSMDASVLNVCGGDETTPIRITYTGTGGSYNASGRYIGDNPNCQPIPSWVSGIITTVPRCD